MASKRTPERIKQIRYFLLQYDEALKQQATAVIMYMDESQEGSVFETDEELLQTELVDYTEAN